MTIQLLSCLCSAIRCNTCKTPSRISVSQTHQQGASLVMVMMILVIVSLLGVSGAQIALMSERGARNDRDVQIAFQAAETALYDATNDMENVDVATRSTLFTPLNNLVFISGCGTTGTRKGLCLPAPTGDKPVWLTTDFTATDSPTTEFGEFTGASFDAGTAGVRPAAKPRYVIETISIQSKVIGSDRSKSSATSQITVYRVTAMGFGPRKDIQGVVQMLYRKE